MNILAINTARNKRLAEITKLVKRDWIPDIIENAMVEMDTASAWFENLSVDLELQAKYS